MADCLLTLTPEFRIKVNEVIRLCASEGVELHPYCGLRTCTDQAKLFRQSRSAKDIEQKAQSLRDRGFSELADILNSVGPQKGELGKHVTRAGPGESWHQYGVAVDCVPLVGGKALWGSDAKEWQIYGVSCRHVGLTWAGDWTSFKEFPHSQLHQLNNPLSFFRSPQLAIAGLKEAGAA